MSQKEIFLHGEGDAWYHRNIESIQGKDFTFDPVVSALSKISASGLLEKVPVNVLEVGCGSGDRLRFIKSEFNFEVFGVEPSQIGVEAAGSKGIKSFVGTADDLPFQQHFFDVVIFGFCLYLCDREDLFRIAAECNRVLKHQGWIVIHDFYSKSPYKKEYHHKPGVFSYKMDYSKLFTWHPAFTCFSHSVTAHQSSEFIDDPNEFVATTILRKNTTTI